MADARRFVLWRLIQKAGEPKPRKVPVDVAGEALDAQDASRWLTLPEARDAAQRGGYGVGIALNGDGLFCVDLDGVRDAATGELTPIAQEIVDRFAGAAVEVSQSGEGLHIFGRCDPDALGPRRNKWSASGQRIEFYTQGRFIAFGGGAFQGDADRDFTTELAAFVPPRAEADSGAELPAGRDPAWSGPEDDAELIARVRSWSGGAAAVFGAKPPFDALWTGNAPVLAQFFPPSNEREQFDHSAADLSLMSTLAFATGRDAIRMERLFAQSALAAREKWKRPDYRRRTISKACASCASVYSEAKREVPQNAPGIPELPLVGAASLYGQPIPEQVWAIDKIAPAFQPCMISGDGGLGKSQLALDMAVAIVTGGTWLGRKVIHGPVLYVSCEDELDEVHRRLRALCSARAISLQSLGDLHIAPMAGFDSMLAVTSGGVLRSTAVFEALARRVETIRPVLVVLDSLADVFGGNEIVKAEVRAFVGMLRALGLRTNCTPLILAHPSLTGMASGSGLSGNTAWNNSVRSRLYLRPAEGGSTARDLRVLEVMKNNRGERGLEIRLRWQAGTFVALDGGAPEAFAEWDVDRLFLELLGELCARGVELNAGQGPNNAASVIAQLPEAQQHGLDRRMLRASLMRLLRAGRITRTETRRDGKVRHFLAPAAPANERVTTGAA